MTIKFIYMIGFFYVRTKHFLLNMLNLLEIRGFTRFSKHIMFVQKSKFYIIFFQKLLKFKVFLIFFGFCQVFRFFGHPDINTLL